MSVQGRWAEFGMFMLTTLIYSSIGMAAIRIVGYSASDMFIIILLPMLAFANHDDLLECDGALRYILYEYPVKLIKRILFGITSFKGIRNCALFLVASLIASFIIMFIFDSVAACKKAPWMSQAGIGVTVIYLLASAWSYRDIIK